MEKGLWLTPTKKITAAEKKGTKMPTDLTLGDVTETLLCLTRALDLIQEWTDTGHLGVEIVEIVRRKIYQGYPIHLQLDVVSGLIGANLVEARKCVNRVITAARTNMLTAQHFWYHRSRLEWGNNPFDEILPTGKEFEVGFDSFVAKVTEISTIQEVETTVKKLMKVYSSEDKGKMVANGGGFAGEERTDIPPKKKGVD